MKLIFLVGNSASRKTSAADQKAHEAPPLTCGLIAASEKTLGEIVATSRVTLTEGISARLLEVVVSGKNGIFHNVPEGLTPKQFSDQLKTAYEIASGDWSSDVCSSDLAFIYHLDLLFEMKEVCC